MLALCSSGYSQGWRWLEPWRLIGGCTYWSAAGFSSEVRAGVDKPKRSPARKWRAMGRIEQTLSDEGRRLRPNRPKTFARYPHPTTRRAAFCNPWQRAGRPRRIPRPGRSATVRLVGPDPLAGSYPLTLHGPQAGGGSRCRGLRPERLDTKPSIAIGAQKVEFRYRYRYSAAYIPLVRLGYTKACVSHQII
jgi:hypothetical protein